MWSFNKKCIACIVLLCALTGCGYTFSGMAPIDLPQGKKRLCITKFINPSTEAWLEPSLRSELRDEFTRRGQVTWVQKDEAETLVTIRVLTYSSSSTLKASDDETVKSAIQLSIEVQMYNAEDHTLIWSSGTIYASESYRGDGNESDAQTDAIAKATADIQNKFQFNTVIAAAMEMVNYIYKVKETFKTSSNGPKLLSSAVSSVLTLLSPITPHICEELWESMGYPTHLSEQPWPAYDPNALHKDEITIVIQVNGKLRSRIDVDTHATKDEIKQKALDDTNVIKHTQGKTIKKIIVIPEKLVNVVVQ